MSVIITGYSKEEITTMSGVMKVMNDGENNIKPVDGLIAKILELESKEDILKAIKEYCEESD